MPIKPSPTIAGKLRKLFSNNKQTIEPAIDDTLPGGGGANVLTLYLDLKNETPWAYKNPECTEEYESTESALSALSAANVIKLISNLEAFSGVFFPYFYTEIENDVYIVIFVEAPTSVYLFKNQPL